MQVEAKYHNGPKFKDMKEGDVFWYCNILYICTDSDAEKWAFSLKDGTGIIIGLETLVTRAMVKVVDNV